jgi:hypothetical protein
MSEKNSFNISTSCRLEMPTLFPVNGWLPAPGDAGRAEFFEQPTIGIPDRQPTAVAAALIKERLEIFAASFIVHP